MYQYLVGGLGNQLFQFAMLHYILENTKEPSGTIWFDQSPRSDRPFLLADAVSNCMHVKSIEKPYSGARGGISRVLNQLPQSKLLNNWRVRECREDLEFNFITDKNVLTAPNKFWIGYFQHFKYVERVWDSIQPEIFHAINQSTPEVILPPEYNLIHVRGGDFYKLKDSHGVLSAEYFLRALRLIDPSRNTCLLVVTDDLENTKSICNVLNPDLVLGPESLNEWDTLRVMSRSKNIITSNSTFSWWGGRLALEMGGQVLIPRPWFKSSTIGEKDAFEYPGFRSVLSVFQL